MFQKLQCTKINAWLSQAFQALLICKVWQLVSLKINPQVLFKATPVSPTQDTHKSSIAGHSFALTKLNVLLPDVINFASCLCLICFLLNTVHGANALNLESGLENVKGFTCKTTNLEMTALPRRRMPPQDPKRPLHSWPHTHLAQKLHVLQDKGDVEERGEAV